MSIIRIPANSSMRVSLRRSEPIGKRGHEYHYILENGTDHLYVPPIAHAEIQSLRPATGEEFTLGNRVEQGNAQTWYVERIPEQPARKPPQSSRSIALPLEQPAAQACQLQPDIAPENPTLTTPESIRLYKQLIAAIEAAKAAEDFAKRIGYELIWTSEDVRAMAISNSIAEQQGKRRYAA